MNAIAFAVIAVGAGLLALLSGRGRVPRSVAVPSGACALLLLMVVLVVLRV